MSKFEYGGNSVALEVATKQIKLYKDSLALCPKVMEVVRKFDGKVANKRLETALTEVDEGLRCRKSAYSEAWELWYFSPDRCVTVTEKSWDGTFDVNKTYSIKDVEVYLAIDVSNGRKDERFVDNNGRWIAGNICNCIEKRMINLEVKIEKYEEELKHVDELEAEQKRIKAEIDAFNCKVSWLGSEYFGLRI